ncbi:carbohydrate ABC transporter membrane protein 2 (CUT1 family) [Halanaerobium saccharolyticum]|uniref:Carbohydrate ABC transporter membrane protein 2 (CUT1 family) n=1 Tax=Halanaerobium saccharolyticum TaxID=43595 RepID=A0A4R7Z9C8_9FIRM|nr:carbohydrate ABC transporter permease [Halanaerobium saccharolyticum]RAK12513.1 carbohydrate ABC transporter membrane protein 2 (CUT1 family) [Halanaerobium saccharolyticum]TDW06439.1 carbohydrate ABC transporter membrane protein 2 (CUT1 family) [Halanaerobium saccharolyticum]TDX61687.1 carbohydrate ABC transporter membrane protein 2 (CUT1 family) [Halanaerobium saccharolyticum]
MIFLEAKEETSIVKFVKYFILILISIFMILPFLWMLSASFKSPGEISLLHYTLIPEDFTLSNYFYALTELNIWRYFLNSVIVAFFGVIMQTVVCSLAAYSLARFNYPGSVFLLTVFIGTMMLPDAALMVPLFRILRTFSLINSYAGMILPVIPWGFSVFMLSEFFKEIPPELEESARIDGASSLQIFIKIILPLSKPVFGAVFIFSFIMVWDQFIIPLLVANSQSIMTLPLWLANLSSETSSNRTIVAAATTLATIPSIIIFMLFQRNFIQGLTSGAVKG